MISGCVLACFTCAAVIPVFAEEVPMTERQLSGHKICWSGHGSALFGAGGNYRFFRRDGSPGKKNGTWTMEGETVHVSHDDGTVAFMNLTYDPQSKQVRSAGDNWTGSFC